MSMIEVETADLIGPALDWAVAQIEGVKTMMLPKERGSSERKPFALFGSMAFELGGAAPECSYSPSTCWHCGGPLIEKYGCELHCIAAANCWEANCWDDDLPTPGLHLHEADTPLIAACRAIVSAKLGDVVKVPAELVGGV